MKQKTDGFMIILAVLFIVLIVFALMLGVSKEWVFALLTAMMTALGWIYSNSKISERDIATRHFSEMAALYKEIFDLYPGLLKNIKGLGDGETPQIDDLDDPKTQELAARLIDIKSQLLIWGSEETILAWIKIEDNADDSIENVRNWGKLYASMRSDLGHSDITINGDHMIGIFLDKDSRQEFVG